MTTQNVIDKIIADIKADLAELNTDYDAYDDYGVGEQEGLQRALKIVYDRSRDLTISKTPTTINFENLDILLNSSLLADEELTRYRALREVWEIVAEEYQAYDSDKMESMYQLVLMYKPTYQLCATYVGYNELGSYTNRYISEEIPLEKVKKIEQIAYKYVPDNEEDESTSDI